MCQRLTAGHDVNGNPRTLWLEYSQATGDIVACHMQGYEGMPRRLYSSIPLPEISVTYKEFSYWKKRAKDSSNILFYD